MSLILHVAQVEITRESGMGRVAWHWRQAFQERGHEFVHIGPTAIGKPVHPALFPYAAYLTYRRAGLAPEAILVHEPAGAPFVVGKRPTVVFSHGIERRGWAIALASHGDIAWRSRLLFPLWRLSQCDFALRRAPAALVLNREDFAFAKTYYHRPAAATWLFRNGVYPAEAGEEAGTSDVPRVLFVGQWFPRKGTDTLIEAATLLHRRGLAVRWLLAGVGCDAETLLAAWPADLRPHLEIVSRFSAAEEAALFTRADIFVLPSRFEGQPLALLQAMASGLCCVASRTCGQKDLIEHGHTGLLHEVGDAAELASRLGECLVDATMRRELGRNAKAAVAGRTWDVVAGEVVDYVEALIARRRTGGGSRSGVRP